MLQRKFTPGTRSIAYLEYANQYASGSSDSFDHKNQLPSLVILHGLFGMADNWHSFSESLLQQATQAGKGLKIYSLDLPGHGASSWQASYRYEAMAKSIATELLDSLDEPIVLIGHSLGGKTALYLAQHEQTFSLTSIAGLVVVDIAPVLYPDRHKGIFQALMTLNVSACHSRSAAQAALSSRIQDSMIRGFLLKNLAIDSEQGGSWIVDVSSLARQYDELRGWPESHGSYPKPSLWIMGELSEYYEPKEQIEAAIKSIAPNAQFQVIPGVGHWVHAEKKDETVSVVFDFLQSIES
jgi:esterase